MTVPGELGRCSIAGESSCDSAEAPDIRRMDASCLRRSHSLSASAWRMAANGRLSSPNSTWGEDFHAVTTTAAAREKMNGCGGDEFVTGAGARRRLASRWSAVALCSASVGSLQFPEGVGTPSGNRRPPAASFTPELCVFWQMDVSGDGSQEEVSVSSSQIVSTK